MELVIEVFGCPISVDLQFLNKDMLGLTKALPHPLDVLSDAEVDVVDPKSAKHSRLVSGGTAASTAVVGKNLVLKADGAVGWIVVTNQLTPPVVGYEVHAVDASGSKLLDSGARIDPSSLALGGSSLYWTDAGQVRSARLR